MRLASAEKGPQMAKRVIVDFDNTTGVPDCDVDDGLALLFLLGNPDLCQVEALTCAYGNSTIDVVYQATRQLAAELGLSIPVLKGGADAHHATSEAASHLARTAAVSPGEVSVLATGSLTNLKGAMQQDPAFLGNLREIALMGGVTGALAINGRILDELNFSCDAEATALVLAAPCPVMDAVSQNCLPCLFTEEELVDEFGRDSWLIHACSEWFKTMERRYQSSRFVCWDLVAAAYLIRPDLFEDRPTQVALCPRWFSVGLLETASAPDTPSVTVNLPVIKDPEAFKQAAFEAWHRALTRVQ